MKKEEYMDSLKDALIGFNDEFASDVIRDYEEHFAIGVKEGKAEEDICLELGDIEEAVYILKNEYVDYKKMELSRKEEQEFRDKAKEENKRIRREFKERVSRENEPFGTESHERNKESKRDSEKNRAEYKGQEKQENGSGRTEYKEQEKQEKESGGTEFGEKGKSYSREKGNFESDTEFYEQPKETLQLEIQMFAEDIELYPSMDGELHADYNGREEDIEQERRGGTVRLTAKHSEQEGMDINFLGLHLFHIPGNFGGKVRVEVPKGLRRVQIKTVSGDILAENLQAEEIFFSTTSGEMRAENLRAKRMEAKLTSGDIELSDSSLGKANLRSMSGDVLINRGKFGALKAESMSGDIELERTEFDRILGTSKSGDITIRLNERKGMLVRVSTISGDSSIAYGNEHIRISGSFEREFGDGSGRIDAKTISGDIRIS